MKADAVISLDICHGNTFLDMFSEAREATAKILGSHQSKKHLHSKRNNKTKSLQKGRRYLQTTYLIKG